MSMNRPTAVLAGAGPPPSDTESSSDEERAPKSLDEGVLNNDEEKQRKQKESKKRSKKKEKRRKAPEGTSSGFTLSGAEPQPLNNAANASTVHEVSRGEGDDVLIKEEPQEVVELSSDDDVLIKEEPPEVVELSSDDDEKPNVPQLQETTQQVSKPVKQEDDQETNSNTTENSQSPTVIKVSDFMVIVTKTQPSNRVERKRAPKATEYKGTDAVVANKPENSEVSVSTTSEDKPKSHDLESKAPVGCPLCSNKYDRDEIECASMDWLRKNYCEEDSESTTSEDDLSACPFCSDDRDEIMSQASNSEKNDLESKDLQENTQPPMEVESNNKEEHALQSNLNLDKNLEQQQIAAREITESEINTNEAQCDDIETAEANETLAVDEINNTNAVQCANIESNQTEMTLDVDATNIRNEGEIDEIEENIPKEAIVADEIKNENEEQCLIKDANGAIENIVDNEPVASTVEGRDDIEEKDCSNESQVSQIQLGKEEISPRSENETEIIEQTAGEAPNPEDFELAEKDSDFSITKSEVKAPLDNVTEEAVDESNDDPKTDSTEASSDAAKDVQSPSQKKTCKKKK